MMYKILCRFAGSDKLEDVFCDNSDLETAKHFADRWKQGAYCYGAEAVLNAVVVDSCNNVVYTAA